MADEVDEVLYGEMLVRLAPDLVVSCGDLPFEYLEYMVTILSVPLLYVPGNHDPDLRRREAPEPGLLLGGGALRPELPGSPSRPAIGSRFEQPPGPQGCVNVDGRIEEAAGLVVAGLGGSILYAEGPNRYTQGQMRRRALRLEARARIRGLLRRRPVDVLVTHSPPHGLGDDPEDPAHVGFAAFHRLVPALRPRLLVHGHIHPHGEERPDRRLGNTTLVNAVPYRMLEVPK